MLQTDEQRTPTIDGILHSNCEGIETYEVEEISMLCLQCSNYVNLKYLQEHRTLHKALSLYQYDFKTKPTSEQVLSRQRATLIKDLNKLLNISRSAYQKELGKIDLAYEVIKAEIYGRSNRVKPSFIENRDVVIRTVKVKLHEAVALGVGASTNEKWRSVMEDAYSYMSKCTESRTIAYLAVFDGYSGPTAARKCSDQFYQILKETFGDFNFSECIEGKACSHSTAFQRAFEEMDKVLLLGAEETSRNRWSGCSATTCILTNNTLHIANVGNVKAVQIGEHDSWQTLTEDHSPANKKEKRRIKACGDIHKWSKTVWVNGVAMTTRGLGNHGDPILKSNVINTPAVCCMGLAYDGEIILVATYGFWQVFNENELLIIIKEWLKAKAFGTDVRTNNEISDENNCNYSGNAIEILVENEDALDAESAETNTQSKGEETVPNNDMYPSKTGINENYTILNKSHCLQCTSGNSLNKNCNCESSQNLLENTTDINHHIYNLTTINIKSEEQRTDEKQSVLELLRELLTKYDRDDLALEISKHLIKAALTAGAKENITVMVIITCKNGEN